MPLIFVTLMTLLVIVLTRAFIINAMALRRDIDRRFDELRVRLESQANSMLDGFLKANAGDDRSN
jgi:hypothetical protein